MLATGFFLTASWTALVSSDLEFCEAPDGSFVLTVKTLSKIAGIIIAESPIIERINFVRLLIIYFTL
ncbi:hypothetical protein A3C33_02810 [Candidatus Curtissbacteria bacterium RIFCSPHIGHO2_02_FULL_42_58]|nr:MAG: hypothetical protein A3C33_02810 [Candidatus Curtissbacteria bacterium RIFCSPHIGHO2_02_FULL_42_58]OGD97735.1 MAG: hypothetical protein A3E71_03320 [Candidatus Curtissbacteria bacterium RIFCSPHIGHO2_12_FULL_42_33]